MFRSPGIPIGRLFGISITLHPTWFVMLFLVTYSLAGHYVAQLGVSAGPAFFLGLIVALLAFASLLAHEFGHALTARYFGIGTERITLFLLGGVAQIKEEPRSPGQELLVAIAGPAVSLLCFALFGILALLALAGGLPAPIQFGLQALTSINFVFAAFNMLPGFPMDGGRVLRAIVWWASGDYLRSTRAATLGGQMLGMMLVVLGVFLLFRGFFQGIMLILLGLFLNWLARMSLQSALHKATFDSVKVGDLMRPVQFVVPADMSIGQVVRDYIYRVHADRFPVVRDSTLLGYISADDIAEMDKSQWDTTPAEKLVRPYGRREILAPSDDILSAAQKVNQLGRPNLPVFSGRQLIGFLFINDVMNHIRNRTRLGDV